MKDPCGLCEGTGSLRCEVCDGAGILADSSLLNQRCPKCHGSGREVCQECAGTGIRRAPVPSAYRDDETLPPPIAKSGQS